VKWVVHMATTAMLFIGVLVVVINMGAFNPGAAMSGVCLFAAGYVLRWSFKEESNDTGADAGDARRVQRARPE
jgi:hypothetical protein